MPERRPIAEIDVEVLLQDPPRALARDGLVIEQRDTLLHAVGDSRQVTQRRFEALEDVADLAFAAAHVAGGNVTGRPGDQEQRASEIGYGVEEVDAPGVVGIWFPLNMVLNAGWIFAWHYQLVGLSVLIMLALLATLIVMFLNIDAMIRATGSQRFARVPISVYFGWITIATIANITAFLVSVGWGGFGVSDVVWTIVVIAAGLAVNVLMLLRHRSFAFAAVAVWAFAGIAVKRIGEGTPEGPGVLIAALAAGGALVVLGVVLAIRGRSVA